jgi:hypothetical protein
MAKGAITPGRRGRNNWRKSFPTIGWGHGTRRFLTQDLGHLGGTDGAGGGDPALAGVRPFAISHADELMQYLEQGRRLAMGDGIVPWEYRVGARNGIVAQLLCVPWWLAAQVAPGR